MQQKRYISVEDYIFSFEGEQLKLLQYFHQILSDELGLIPKIKYNIPFYYRHSWICYLNATKNSGIELAFPRGNELSNTQGILEAKGRKQVRGVIWYNVKELHESTIMELLQEAILLDETVKYPSKRNRPK